MKIVKQSMYKRQKRGAVYVGNENNHYGVTCKGWFGCVQQELSDTHFLLAGRSRIEWVTTFRVQKESFDKVVVSIK